MSITGRFEDNLPRAFIKIGMTRRDAGARLKEVIASLKPYGSGITGKVQNVGRLERLLHHRAASASLPVGGFREYFREEECGPLTDQLRNMTFTEYQPAKVMASAPVMPGRRKKSRAELLAEYPAIVAGLEAGRGIRQVSRETGRSVNTVQKVKAQMAG